MEAKGERPLNSIRQEKCKKASENLIEFISQHLDYTTYGFHTSYHDLERHNPYVALDSEWCRVSFTLDMNRPYEQDMLKVRYGRVHAPNEQFVMEWEGKSCWCWHKYIHAVFFIAGITPEETVDMMSRRDYPNVVQEFFDSKLASQYHKEYRPKYDLHLHKTIWEHYGQRFFEVFDVRQFDIWEQFKFFVKEIFRIKGRTSLPIVDLPPSYEIC